MAEQLVLLTSKYPCAKGEEFLESEIEHLAERFSRVYVVPTYLQGDHRQTRELPENCELVIPAFTRERSIRPLARRAFTALRSSMVEINPLRPLAFPLDMRFALRSIESADRVATALKEAGVDPRTPTVLYAYWLYRPAAVSVLLRDHYFTGQARAVSRAHGFDVYPDRAAFGHLPSRRFLIDSLDLIFPISKSAAGVISQIRGASTQRIEVARLGVTGPAEVPERHLSRPVHFVSCSSLPPLKQVDKIAQAFGEVLRVGDSNFRWTHIGDSGPESLEALRTTIRDEGLSEHSKALGRMDNRSVIDFFSRPDVHFLVNFSSSEGVPVTIMEAAANGVPAIATNVGGTGEFVENGHNGLLLDAGASTEELVAAIRHSINADQGRYRAMSISARDVWAQMSNANVQYPRFADRLEGIALSEAG